MIARLPVPLHVLHRNELAPELAALLGGTALPIVIAHHDDGSVSRMLAADELAGLGGSVEAFALALGKATPVVLHGKDS